MVNKIKHKELISIRNQLLLRISFVLGKLSKEHTVNSLCRYQDKEYSFKNLDKLLSISEKLRIEYSFTVHSKNGRTYSKFGAKTVSDWSTKTHKLNISSKHF